MPDGYLRIKTKIDNSEVNKDILVLENKIKKLQLNNANVSTEQSSLQREIKNYEQLIQKADEYKNKRKQLYTEKQNIFLDTASNGLEIFGKNYTKKLPAERVTKYNEIISELDNIEAKYLQISQEIDKQAPKIEKIHIKLDKLKAKQTENNDKISEYNMQLQESQKKQLTLNYSTEGISKSLNKGISKILKYGAALFGIHSIYGLLSNAMNSWLNGNSNGAKQLKSDIDYMKNAIGRALSPILKYIVNLLYQALGFTGALIKAFTGVNIFAGSTADYMSSSASSANKTNKELKKQLASFDKINKLEKNDSNTSSLSGNGAVKPSQDLSNVMEKYIGQAEILKENFLKIKDYIVGAGIALCGWKIGDLLGLSTKASIGLGLTLGGLYFFWEGVKGFQDGEITSEDLLKTLAGVIGVGVGIGFLTCSVPMGISATLFMASWAIASFGESRIPDWVKDLIGLESVSGRKNNGANLMKMLGIPQQIRFDLSLFIYIGTAILEGLDALIPGFKNQIYQKVIIPLVEEIPIFGKNIAEAMQKGISGTGSTITTSLVNTTKTAFGNAEKQINETSVKEGRQAGKNWLLGMKTNIKDEQTNLQTTIETTIENASDNSKTSIENNGKEAGNNYMNATQNTISNSKDILKNSIKDTSNKATGENKDIFEQNGKKLGTKTIDGIKSAQTSQTNSLSSNTTEVVRNANNSVNTSSSNSIGKNIVSGIKSGINGDSWSLCNTMKNLGTQMLNSLKDKLGIHSPSREMASLAKFIPLGIAEGIDSTSNKAVNSMKNLVMDIEDTASNMKINYNIPKLSKNAISFIPKQAISTNEIQRKIIGNNEEFMNQILGKLNSSQNDNGDIIVYNIIDDEVIQKVVRKKNKKYDFATNGGF